MLIARLTELRTNTYDEKINAVFAKENDKPAKFIFENQSDSKSFIQEIVY